jgi:hypothetical protein
MLFKLPVWALGWGERSAFKLWTDERALLRKIVMTLCSFQRGISFSLELGNCDTSSNVELGNCDTSSNVKLGNCDTSSNVKLGSCGTSSNVKLGNCDTFSNVKLGSCGTSSNVKLGNCDTSSNVKLWSRQSIRRKQHECSKSGKHLEHHHLVDKTFQTPKFKNLIAKITLEYIYML